MFQYMWNNAPMLMRLMLEHMQIVLISVSLGVLVSLVITFIIYTLPFSKEPLMIVLRILYTIPSLAFFAFLIPFLGIGFKNAVVVLSVYTLFFLVNSFLNGLYHVDEAVLDAAKAVGYTPRERFISIQLPLALPDIVTGIRLASVSTIGITCIAYTIGAGGLGSILFEGMRQSAYPKILTGSFLVIVLNIFTNTILLKVSQMITKKLYT